MKKWIILIGMLILVSLSYGFDGERKGFILGGGIGGTLGKYDQNGKESNKIGLGTNLKIGYSFDGISDFFYFSKVSWYEEEIEYSDKKWDSTYGIAGIGYGRRIKNYYIDGGIGISRYTFDYKDSKENENGIGMYMGAGYNFTKNINISVEYVYGKTDNTSGNILMLMLNGEIF